MEKQEGGKEWGTEGEGGEGIGTLGLLPTEVRHMIYAMPGVITSLRGASRSALSDVSEFVASRMVRCIDEQPMPRNAAVCEHAIATQWRDFAKQLLRAAFLLLGVDPAQGSSTPWDQVWWPLATTEGPLAGRSDLLAFQPLSLRFPGPPPLLPFLGGSYDQGSYGPGVHDDSVREVLLSVVHGSQGGSYEPIFAFHAHFYPASGTWGMYTHTTRLFDASPAAPYVYDLQQMSWDRVANHLNWMIEHALIEAKYHGLSPQFELSFPGWLHLTNVDVQQLQAWQDLVSSAFLYIVNSDKPVSVRLADGRTGTLVPAKTPDVLQYNTLVFAAHSPQSKPNVATTDIRKSSHPILIENQAHKISRWTDAIFVASKSRVLLQHPGCCYAALKAQLRFLLPYALQPASMLAIRRPAHAVAPGRASSRKFARVESGVSHGGGP